MFRTAPIFVPGYQPQRRGFARSGGGGFVPTDIAGLQLWLDASQIVGLSDGDPVASWTDESGSGFTATQGTSGNRPTYQTNELNGLPVIRFDGTDDTLTVPAGFLNGLNPATGVTLFMVFNPGDLGSYRVIGDSSSRVLSTFLTGYYGLFTTAAAADFSSLTTTSQILAITAVTGGSGGNYYRNGSLVDTRAAGSSTANEVWELGSNPSSGGQPYLGDLAEVIAYSGVLSTSDMNQVGNYLERWGMTWTDI